MTLDSTNQEALAKNQNTAPEVLRQLAFTIRCSKINRSIGDIIRSPLLIWELLEPEDMQEHLEFI